MAYSADTFVADEQPTTAKWNKLWTNDASFNDGTGIGAVIGNQHFVTGVPVQMVSANFSAVVTGAGVIPYDDTIPQITEGLELMTLAITPKSATNILVIQVEACMGVSINSQRLIAMFQDSTTDALSAKSTYVGNWTDPVVLTTGYRMVAGTTSSTTFRVRGGCESAGSVTLNGAGGARKFGTSTKSTMTITEYKAS